MDFPFYRFVYFFQQIIYLINAWAQLYRWIKKSGLTYRVLHYQSVFLQFVIDWRSTYNHDLVPIVAQIYKIGTDGP